MLTLTPLTKVINEKTLIAFPAFELALGETLALIGHNGSGKTTFLHLLTGMTPPTTGTVTLNGVPLAKQPLAFKKQLFFVPATPTAFLHFTPQQYWQLLQTLFACDSESFWQRCEHYCTYFDLPAEAVTQLLAECSLGTQKKIAFIAAFAIQPALCVFDEPFTGLDPQTRTQLQTLMQTPPSPMSFIFTTHDLALAHACADFVAELNAGTCQRLTRQQRPFNQAEVGDDHA